MIHMNRATLRLTECERHLKLTNAIVFVPNAHTGRCCPGRIRARSQPVEGLLVRIQTPSRPRNRPLGELATVRRRHNVVPVENKAAARRRLVALICPNRDVLGELLVTHHGRTAKDKTAFSSMLMHSPLPFQTHHYVTLSPIESGIDFNWSLESQK